MTARFVTPGKEEAERVWDSPVESDTKSHRKSGECWTTDFIKGKKKTMTTRVKTYKRSATEVYCYALGTLTSHWGGGGGGGFRNSTAIKCKFSERQDCTFVSSACEVCAQV